jgi:hypothetical protein
MRLAKPAAAAAVVVVVVVPDTPASPNRARHADYDWSDIQGACSSMVRRVA